MKKTLTIGLSMLILAIACLSCAKDPQTPNTNLEFNGLSVLEEDGYISEVQPVLPDKEYRFGFRMTGNAENQLSRLVVRFNEEVICDTAIGGIEFEYRGVISTRGISGTAEISAVVVYDDYGFSRASIGLIVEEREKQTLPYVQDFSSSFGTYIPVDVRGPQFWRIDGTAVMTNASYYYNRNDDWLVSSPVEITDVTDAKMLMEYRCEGFDNVNKCVTIWALKCNDGDSLALAQWTQLPVTLASVNHDDNYVYYESGALRRVRETA